MRYYFYRIIGGVILIVVGLLIWLSNLEVINIAWRRDWPVILIIIGVIELIKHIIKRR
jgi:uncharacterized integral membrane protein